MSEFEYLGGYVTSSKDFIGGSRREINNEGIFSQRVFGPINSYKCKCGYYNSKTLYENMCCPKCNVLCISNDIRFTTFGKIRLSFPFIKKNKQCKFLKLINANSHKDKKIINPIRSKHLNTEKKYLAISADRQKIIITDTLDPRPGFLTIPSRITGVYSLYLVLRFLKEKLEVPAAIEIFEKKYISYEMKVIPAGLRPISYDSVKRESISPPINTFYTALLKAVEDDVRVYSVNIETDESDFLERIRHHLKEGILDQDIFEPTIAEYDNCAAKYQYNCDKIYDEVYNELTGKKGLIRSAILGKNIEFSARTVIRADPSIKPYEIRVSRKVLKKLWNPIFIYWITNVHGLDYDYSYENIVLYESNNTKILDELFDKFLKWFYSSETISNG